MAIMHITIWEFYDLTPIEVDYVIKAYIEIIESQTQLSWEQVRTQIYYNYLLTPSKKRKVSYQIFKKDYLPFSFDKDEKRSEENIIDDEAFDSIQDYFKKITKGT